MAEVLAFLAAVAFAVGIVLQQKGTLETAAGADDPRFLVQILRRPIWLAGAIVQGCGWVLQAAALDRGSLVVVQAITTLSLVLALPLGHWLTHQHITLPVFAGALSVLVGIVLFISVSPASSSTSLPNAAEWWAAGLVTAAAVATLALLGSRRHGAGRALLFGAAAGFGFALQAAVTKDFVTLIGSGLGAVLSSWTTYVLILSALSGFALQQSALKTGVLAPAVASSNSVTLIVGVVLGITVFDETLKTTADRLSPALVGLVLAVVGIAFLASAPPPGDVPPGGQPEDVGGALEADGRGPETPATPS